MSETITLTISAVALQVTGVALATAASAIAALATARLSAQARRVLTDVTAAIPTTLQTIGPANLSPTTAVKLSGRLSAQEARLVSELTSVATLAVPDTGRIQEALQARPMEEWAGIVRQEHQRLFRQTLTEAVSRACQRLEFAAVRSAGDRLVAEDRHGRALALQLSDDGRIRAEVLGVADRTCHALVDRFLRALEAEGVKIAKIDNRRWTGGTPQTEAGRTWISQKAGQTASSGPARSTERRVKGTPRVARIRR